MWNVGAKIRERILCKNPREDFLNKDFFRSGSKGCFSQRDFLRPKAGTPFHQLWSSTWRRRRWSCRSSCPRLLLVRGGGDYKMKVNLDYADTVSASLKKTSYLDHFAKILYSFAKDKKSSYRSHDDSWTMLTLNFSLSRDLIYFCTSYSDDQMVLQSEVRQVL